MKKIYFCGFLFLFAFLFISINGEKAAAIVSDLTTIDFNGNGEIDQGDVDILSKYYNITSKDANYNKIYDLNNDGIIDIYDIVLVQREVGHKALKNDTDITDEFKNLTFRNEVLKALGKNSSQKITFADARSLKNLNVMGKNIDDMSGIEYCTELENLNCSHNNIKALNIDYILPLDTLDCSYNDLTSLNTVDIFRLANLNCNYNQIKVFTTNILDYDKKAYATQYTDSSKKQLTTTLTSMTDDTDITAKFTDQNFKKEIYKVVNKAEGTPILISDVKKIKELNIAYSGIQSLNGIEYFQRLEVLNCQGNNITNLDLDCNIKLKTLTATDNKLTSINVNHACNLDSVDISNNALSSLDVSNNKYLSSLTCTNNNIKVLDVTKNNMLKKLDCEENRLTTLDVSKNKDLEYFKCCNNELKTLYDFSERFDEYSYMTQYTNQNHDYTSDDLTITIKNN